MIELFVASTTKYSGKTLVAIGILDHWRRKGMRTGYFKPIGKNFAVRDDHKVEEDAAVIKEHFALEDDLTMMCPLNLGYSDYVDLLLGKLGDAEDRIYGAYMRLRSGKDAVVVGGGQDLSDGSAAGVSNSRFIEKFSMPTVLVDAPISGDVNLDAVVAARERLKEKLAGVILNRLPRERLDFVRKYVVPFLENKGIAVWGLVPAVPELESLTVSEIGEVLAGTILCCEERKGDLVEGFMVGAMNVEGALRYFRSQANKAVITGGDRADIQLAALETQTRVLILTGGLYPETSVLTAAQEKNVPLMVVQGDTMSVVSKVESAIRGVSVLGNRIDTGIATFRRHVDTGYLEQLSSSRKTRRARAR